uniref:ZP domain-containing protein n=1 Tax=Strongyloides papillosus TaxID=174720 RepID=A0A0N5CCL5_STREA
MLGKILPVRIRSSRPPFTKFRVGQVMATKKYNIRGVVSCDGKECVPGKRLKEYGLEEYCNLQTLINTNMFLKEFSLTTIDQVGQQNYLVFKECVLRCFKSFYTHFND